MGTCQKHIKDLVYEVKMKLIYRIINFLFATKRTKKFCINCKYYRRCSFVNEIDETTIECTGGYEER
jgi:hypothetical protein